VGIDFTGRVAVITGAGNGLGAEYARTLARLGAAVVVNDIGSALDGTPDGTSPAENVVAEIMAAGGKAVANADSVATPEGGRAIVDAAVKEFGRLDIVVNNAGIAPAGRFTDTALAQWRHVFDVNVLGPVALIQSAAEHLLGQGSGKVINIGSLSSLRGKPVLAAYSASKGALLRLTEALSAEWAASGVQVNMIAPGGFATEAQQAVLDDPSVLARRVRKIPTGRMGDADEIAALACYLASPLSNFVTGSCYTIDGGELAKL